MAAWPGVRFPADFNAQLGVFLARANTRPAAGLLVQIRCLADYDAALGVDGGAA